MLAWARRYPLSRFCQDSLKFDESCSCGRFHAVASLEKSIGRGVFDEGTIWASESDASLPKNRVFSKTASAKSPLISDGMHPGTRIAARATEARNVRFSRELFSLLISNSVVALMILKPFLDR